MDLYLRGVESKCILQLVRVIRMGGTQKQDRKLFYEVLLKPTEINS